MKKLLVSIFMFSFLIMSCKDKQSETVVKKDSTEKMTVKRDTAVTVKKEITTGTGKKLVIIESKPSFSISDYMITGSGFENSNDTIKYSLKNPMSTALLADLDKNGFDEVYIITKSAAAGYLEDILAVASINDKTFREVNVQQFTAKDAEKNGKFSGYLGHDSIYISDKKIIREFPVYESSNANIAPVGRRKIIYSLIPGQNSYDLVITGAENMK